MKHISAIALGVLLAGSYLGVASAENNPNKPQAGVHNEMPGTNIDRSADKTDQTARDRSGENDSESTVARASEVYRKIVKNASKQLPTSVSSKANCVAVFPSVVTAALGVGGVHGDGVAFCKTGATGAWSSPVFLDLTGGSIGLQAGAKSTDLVMFMTGDKARQAIQDGKFTIGGELSAVAGSFDQGFAAPASGIVAYTQTEGVFAGASVSGVNISRDEDEQRSFYGQQTASVFDGKVPAKVQTAVNELRALLPNV